ncbi:MAG: peroxide stress protein YaaA [Actinobacteria bacterium]|nr:peroxide stress protein YaaA [Actinomycetota bacterium]
MHILLPPSETKRSGGGSVFSAESLAHGGALHATRIRVRDALVTLSGDAEAAAKPLKLGVKNQDERLHNLELDTSGAMPAIERYTGVLYDALDAATLDEGARAWLAAHVSVQSALFGLIRADDLIPAYRLSGSSRLPALSTTLKRAWSDAHDAITWAELGWVLDLRSKDYVALAPLPAGVGSWLNVVQRGPDGAVRALNHFNKAAKGDLVRRLAISGAEVSTPTEFVDWATAEGLEVEGDPETAELVLVTELG